MLGVHKVSWTLEGCENAARGRLAGIYWNQRLKRSPFAVANERVPILIRLR
jgi:hypothetical protein